MPLSYDPRNVNITQVDQMLVTLESRPVSKAVSTIDAEIEGWAKWAMMNKNLYGNPMKTAAIRELFATSTRYEKQKASTVQRFFCILAAHPEAMVRSLSDLIPHPETQESVFCNIQIYT